MGILARVPLFLEAEGGRAHWKMRVRIQYMKMPIGLPASGLRTASRRAGIGEAGEEKGRDPELSAA